MNMLKSPRFSVLFGSIYLIIYALCLSTESLYPQAWFLFSLYPLLLLWVIYTILKPVDYSIPELDGDEFGYGDRPKDQLGIF